MNLGDIYVKTFLVIIGSSLVIATLLAMLVRWSRRTAPGSVLCIALALWIVMGYFALHAWHRTLFTYWHQMQNTSLPAEGCLTYQPGFARLFATYRMSRAEFDGWVANHPWQLAPGDGMLYIDGPRLGLDAPELTYETESAPNGKQLRVYYKSGVMYVSYNSM